MPDEDDDIDLGPPNTAAAPYGFHGKGLRFMCWPATEDDEDDAALGDDDRPALARPRPHRADLFSSSPELVDAAAATAAKLAEITGNETRWRPITPNGGAGDNWLVDLIQVVGGSAATIYALLQSPKAAKEAWETLSGWYQKLKANERGDDWHAGSEVGILKCIAMIREEIPDADILPETIRVVQDGTDTGMWGDMAAGTHVVVIPELRSRKTFVFAIDSKLEIHGRMTLPHLTMDARVRAEPDDT